MPRIVQRLAWDWRTLLFWSATLGGLWAVDKYLPVPGWLVTLLFFGAWALSMMLPLASRGPDRDVIE